MSDEAVLRGQIAGVDVFCRAPKIHPVIIRGKSRTQLALFERLVATERVDLGIEGRPKRSSPRWSNPGCWIVFRWTGFQDAVVDVKGA
ncbi:hypothetical protein GCM10027597_57510 [Saccharopolyspora tripterygii]